MRKTAFCLMILVTFLPLVFSHAQDWANLKRFQKQNQELSSAMDGNNKIVFMGNSITEGWINMRPGFFEDKPYINRGISGQTTPQMLLRFRQDVIDLNPSVVVILAGTNDIAGNTGPMTLEQMMDNIISMSELAKINKIKVILCSVLPVYDYPWKPGLEPASKIIDLNKMINSYAERNNFIYVDYFSAMVNEQNGLKKELGEDGVHPNEKGYSIMEPLVEAAIKEVVNK